MAGKKKAEEQEQRSLEENFSELEELIEVCHRILIMREGRIVGEVNPDHISVEELYAICMEDIDS